MPCRLPLVKQLNNPSNCAECGQSLVSHYKQLYRYDRTDTGQVTLSIVHPYGGVFETKRGKVREMFKYRQAHYPNAHNYRHHVLGEDGCPTCDKENAQYATKTR